MKLKGQLIIVFLVFIMKLFAQQPLETQLDSKDSHQIFDIDSILNILVSKPINASDSIMTFNADSARFINSTLEITENTEPILVDSIKTTDLEPVKDTIPLFTIPTDLPSIPIDKLVLLNNPFFIDLVFIGKKLDFNWKKDDLQTLYYGKSSKRIDEPFDITSPQKKVDEVINELRNRTRDEITRTAVNLYSTTLDRLPDLKNIQNNYITSSKIDEVKFVENNIINPNDKINVKKEKLNPWSKKAQGMTQFSQNIVSENWHQGGNSNMAVLGVLTGQLNFDNKKNIQFENSVEWRMGFYFVDDSTALRSININNDMFKINSKLGYKIDGNWFYSGSIELSTQFLDNFQAVNSDTKKAAFLTPVRLNIGIGLDYKYQKIFSLALSPISYKHIYVNDTLKVNQNLFGIEKGKKTLNEIGSAFKAKFSYSPIKEIQLNSNLSFYTNYEKVEIDWEIVSEFTVNRFLSTRLSLNPRYDNTVILPNGIKAKIQFKELLSFGFSYKLID